MPEPTESTQVEVKQTRVNSPVPKVYSDSISEFANSLPPAQKFVVPTDEEVLGKQKGLNPTEVNNETEEEVIEEEEEPVIESVNVNTNEGADKAVKEIAGEEKLKEFKLDDAEDEEFIKSLYGKDEPASEVDAEVAPQSKKKATEADLEEKYKPYKEKASEYDAVMSHPLAKAFVEFVKAGKTDPTEFAKEVGFLNVEAMTDVQIIEQDCRNEGLTDEDIETEVEAFNSKSPYEKKKRVNEIKSDLIKKRDEKLKTFSAGSEQIQRVKKEVAAAGRAQLDELIPKMVNKKFKGLMITPEMGNAIQQHVVNYAKPIISEKGQLVGYDIKSSINSAIFELYSEQRDKALIELGRTLGADKTLTARIRPNKKVSTAAAIPSAQKTFDQIATEQADKRWQKIGLSKTTTKK